MIHGILKFPRRSSFTLFAADAHCSFHHALSMTFSRFAKCECVVSNTLQTSPSECNETRHALLVKEQQLLILTCLSSVIYGRYTMRLKSLCIATGNRGWGLLSARLMWGSHVIEDFRLDDFSSTLELAPCSFSRTRHKSICS